MSQDSETIARAAWRAERTDELHSDTTALLDAVLMLGGTDMAVTMLGDLIDAINSQDFQSGTTSADKVLLRMDKAEQVIERTIKWALDEEDARGRWASYMGDGE